MQQDLQKPNEIEPHHIQELNYYPPIPSHTIHHHPEPEPLIQTYIPMSEHETMHGNYIHEHYNNQYYAQSCHMAS